jgi:hypothetical protein
MKYLLDSRSVAIRSSLRLCCTPSGDDFILGAAGTSGGGGSRTSIRTPVVGRGVRVLSFFDVVRHRCGQSQRGEGNRSEKSLSEHLEKVDMRVFLKLGV